MIKCSVTSSTKTDVYKDILSVTLPAFSGQMQILPDHAEAFVLLQKGSIFLRKLSKQSENIQIISGECYIKDDTITIIL